MYIIQSCHTELQVAITTKHTSFVVILIKFSHVQDTILKKCVQYITFLRAVHQVQNMRPHTKHGPCQELYKHVADYCICESICDHNSSLMYLSSPLTFPNRSYRNCFKSCPRTLELEPKFTDIKRVSLTWALPIRRESSPVIHTVHG